MPIQTQSPFTFFSKFIHYTLRDLFSTNASAPITSPRTSEPGPGSLVIQTDTGNKVLISNKTLQLTQTTTSTDPLVYFAQTNGTVQTRVSGLTLAMRLTTTGGITYWGLKAATPFSVSFTAGINLTISTIGFVFGSTGTNMPLALSASYVDIYFVLLTTGALIFARLDGQTVRLLYVTKQSGGNFIDGLAVASNPTPGAGYYLDRRSWMIRNTSIMTPTLSAAPSVSGTDYVGEANGFLRQTFVAPNPLAGSSVSLKWRKLDASNYHEVLLGSDGSLRAYKVVAGVLTEYTSAINVANVYLPGQTVTIVIYAINNQFSVYSEINGAATRRGGITTDSTFQTANTITPTVTLSTLSTLESWAIEKSTYNNEFTPPDFPIPVVICDGDSLTYGAGVNHTTQSYPVQLAALYTIGQHDISNFGVTGQTIVDMSADASTQIDVMRKGKSRQIVVCWGGTNDIGKNNNSATTVYNNIVSYCQARRALGWKVIVVNILKRGDFTAGQETTRQSLNTLLAANWSTFADGFADVASNAAFSDPTNTTYYQADLIHLTLAGYGIIAGIIKTAVDLIS